MKRLKALCLTLAQAPLFWPAFTGALVLLGLTRLLPGISWVLPPSEQAVLDVGYVQNLRGNFSAYEVLEGVKQVYGAHVLPRYALAVFSTFTGDIARAGIWLSLFGVVATVGGVYTLSRSIFPLREFAAVVTLSLSAVGAIQYGISPDPSRALAMALVVWALALFFTAIEKGLPHRVFLSALLLGLAGYIRIELTMMWWLLSLYLLAMAVWNSPAKAKGLPLVGMAVGGLFMMGLVLWPLVDRNIGLAGSPVLPGFDAELILGGVAHVGSGAAPDYFGRFFDGFKMLATDRTGLGIFAGLLWPLGVVVSSVVNRHKAFPFFWAPFIIGWVLALTLISPVTGPESFYECLRITAPILYPFAVLAPVFLMYHWMQTEPKPRGKIVKLWCMVVLGAYVFALLPNLAGGTGREARQAKQFQAILEVFEEDRDLLEGKLLTDRPGLFLGVGKRHVYGLNGETDWRIIAYKYQDGSFRIDEFVKFIQEQSIDYLHLSEYDNPLRDQLAMAENAPEFREVVVSPPHRLMKISWSNPRSSE
ncbi:MAG: hypothetical protein JJU29_02560 [Verrucomicrobia bacterium]|nr:hypothetical protein [Verrucomicrobiota bacterium]MCH8511331.1 hypothetical protein [Kiritimatiellia bacterium]